MIHHRDEPQQLFHGIPAHKNIFRHAALGNGLQLLMHHGNAQLERHQRILDIDLFPFVKDFSLVHSVNAEQAFHQRRLSCAVLPHQGVHGARTELKIHVIQRFDAGERLYNALHFQTVLRHALSFLSKLSSCRKKRGHFRAPI